MQTEGCKAAPSLCWVDRQKDRTALSIQGGGAHSLLRDSVLPPPLPLNVNPGLGMRAGDACRLLWVDPPRLGISPCTIQCHTCQSASSGQAQATGKLSYYRSGSPVAGVILYKLKGKSAGS